ncbi:MAG: FmdB family zinc ribbon protein [Nitrospinales bacterium]
MPIYEYECQKCGVVFEMMQAVSAKPLKTCMGAGCNGRANGKVRRLVSAAGFILKGSGWYATDYPSESRKKGIEADSKAASPQAAHSHAESTASQPNRTPEAKSSSKPNPLEKKSNAKAPCSQGKKKT